MVLGQGRACVGLAAALLVACAADGAALDTDDVDGTGGTAGDEASTEPSATSGQPPSEWGPEQEYALRLGDEDVPPLTLSMRRDEVAELFGDRADEVLLIELDSTALLENTL